MRPESTLEEDTCKWPESDRPGWVSQPRLLTTPLPAALRSPSVPLPHSCLHFDPSHHAWDA